MATLYGLLKLIELRNKIYTLNFDEVAKDAYRAGVQKIRCHRQTNHEAMKRFLLWTIACLLPLCASAQVKKVAILETVDREGNVPYAYKLMLRSNLAKAITDAPGYEAYDRTDMDAIMGEQNFQRTGMVSEDQIKRLGEMTGAAYILVAEAVKADENSMFITAKILNVETAKTEMTENVLMGNAATDMQNGCIALAKTLLQVDISDRSTGSSGARQDNTKQASKNTVSNPKPKKERTMPPYDETKELNAIGLNFGFGMAATYQRKFKEGKQMLTAEVGTVVFGDIYLASTYVWRLPIWNQLSWFVGVGLMGRYYDGGMVGACPHFGIEYNFNIPLQLSLEYRPVLGVGFYRNRYYTEETHVGFAYDFFPTAFRVAVRYRF